MASRGVNKVMLLGHVGQAPEVRYMPNGDPVATLSLATGEVWKDRQGQPQERTEWHRLVVYRGLAEVVRQYVGKGSRLFVEGRLRTRQWEKDGVKHYTTEVIVDELEMLGDGKGRQEESGRQTARDGREARGRAYGEAETAPATPFDDDLPF